MGLKEVLDKIIPKRKKNSGKFKPLYPRRFVVIRWKGSVKSNEDLEFFNPMNRIVEVYHSPDFRRAYLVKVEDYIPGLEVYYKMVGYEVLDLTTGLRSSEALLDTLVSWDIGAFRL